MKDHIILELALCVIVILVYVIGFNDDARVHRALEQSDHSSIRLTGKGSIWHCRSDLLRADFTAKTAKGRDVKGVVCCGVWSKCYIRYD